MKKNFKKVISLLLVFCMILSLDTPVLAAWGSSNRAGSNSYYSNSWGGFWNNFWGNIWGSDDDKNTNDSENEVTEDEISEEMPGMELALVEDQSTVSPAVTMRAAVYDASEEDPVAQAELEDNNVVYYPSTFFDYDHNKIAQSMANLDVQYAVDHGNSTSTNGWTWNGLYFGRSRLDDSTPTGTYTDGEVSYSQANNVRYSNLADSNVTNSQTNYYYYDENADEYYRVSVTRTSSRNSGRTTYTYTLYANGEQICTNNITNTSATFSEVTLYTMSSDGTSVTSGNFAPWTDWGGDNAGWGPSFIHSGMVTGLVDGVPQFAASYANKLFDASEVDGKTRYTNVGLPFIYDEDTGYYTFDSAVNGAYFPNGEAASDSNLTLLDAPVAMYNGTQTSDHDTNNWYTGFMPFNVPDRDTAQTTSYYKYDSTNDKVSGPAYRLTRSGGGKNYYFSMITSVPFTMTENGRIISSDDSSAPIIFDFTGDDDVWVFVDDVLVLDLGGIHDCVSGEINFATNEVTFWATGSGKESGDATENGYGQPENGNNPISQGAIFNDGETIGKLNTTRSTFAASDNHTLTVVYVERGEGLSNNKISFNLPQKDYIAVTKQIDENLYMNTDETTVVGPITDELFATLNARDFTYVLYENGTAMTGVRYSRYDANGNFTGNGSTASDGTFTVKNGETVRFYDVTFDGETSYYVAELDPDYGSTNNAWGTATWAHDIRTAYGESSTVGDITKPDNYYVSNTITTKGSEEAVDVITFTNTNKLLSPVADIADDEYVIDFGLAVELNPLANDTYSATTDSLTLAGISSTSDGTFGNSITGDFGTLTVSGNRVVYTLNKQFTGVEEFYYQVGLTSGADDLEGTVGKVTIMPATTMYYEESFADLSLTFNAGTSGQTNWTDVSNNPQTDYQEEGRVGNTEDSPYGSDVAYSKNSGDSYGTSKYINTTNGYAKFSYTFTGTGTAMYARTSDKSAYLIITVTDAEGNVVSEEWRRNTIYKPTEDTELPDNTLFNIPVYVYEADAYGTYTVNVTVNKAINDYIQDENGEWVESKDLYTRGCDFYLDGIRVYNPANAYNNADNGVTLIEDAYARDGEAYITVTSLRNKLLTDSTKYAPVIGEDGTPVVDEDGEPIYDIAWDGENFVVFTDSNGEIKDALTYQSAGPKEEVYMKAGQSVTFSLENWNQNMNKVYLGIKAPSGSGTVSINGNVIEINNTTDIYYDITKYAEVSRDVATFEVKAESALISVTTIKVTGTAGFTILGPGPEMELPEE